MPLCVLLFCFHPAFLTLGFIFHYYVHFARFDPVRVFVLDCFGNLYPVSGWFVRRKRNQLLTGLKISQGERCHVCYSLVLLGEFVSMVSLSPGFHYFGFKLLLSKPIDPVYCCEAITKLCELQVVL